MKIIKTTNVNQQLLRFNNYIETKLRIFIFKTKQRTVFICYLKLANANFPII